MGRRGMTLLINSNAGGVRVRVRVRVCVVKVSQRSLKGCHKDQCKRRNELHVT